MESVRESLVFGSELNETGEDYLLLLTTAGLLLVRIRLTTKKLSVEAHYNYVSHYVEILGTPRSGPDHVSAIDDPLGRGAVPNEAAFKAVRSAAKIYRCVESVRTELQKHERGHGGVAGVDAVGTLDAWKRNRAWYRAANISDSIATAVGPNHFVTPLRTVPRCAQGGNLFLAAVAVRIGDLIQSLQPNPTGNMAASILSLCRRRLVMLDSLAPCNPPQARAFLHSRKFNGRSGDLVNSLNELAKSIQNPEHIAPGFEGFAPFSLPATEMVFQEVAVVEALLSLGLEPDRARHALENCRNEKGLSFGGLRAWADTPKHGLDGWRDRSGFPSGYRPDLIVRRERDGAPLLLDAKLRSGDSDGGLLSSSGVKDLQAYMQEYKLRRGVLLVPDSAGEGCRCEDVTGDGCVIRAIALPSTAFEDNRLKVNKFLSEMWND